MPSLKSSSSISQSKKRTIIFDDQCIPKKLQKLTSKDSSLSKENNSLYKLYNKFDKELLIDIQNQDKHFNISGLLSYVVNHNWVKKQEIIELVDTKELWNFKEVDRHITPKGDNSLESKCGSIKDKGFFEPLILAYDNSTTTCLLVEGNNRLAYAMLNNIPFVPVKVVEAPLEDGYTILIPDNISPL